MSSIKPMELLARICGTIGAGLGFAIGGPAAVPIAMKAGIAGGIQIAIASKADNVLDAACKKIEAAADKSADVAKLAEKIGITVYSIIVLGAWKFWRALEKEQATLQGRNIQYIQIPQEEFDKLQVEITELKT